jgi:hypothetical protein
MESHETAGMVMYSARIESERRASNQYLKFTSTTSALTCMYATLRSVCRLAANLWNWWRTRRAQELLRAYTAT